MARLNTLPCGSRKPIAAVNQLIGARVITPLVVMMQHYNESSLSPTTLEQHHTLVHSALKTAQLQGIVQRNVASLVIGKPHRPEGRDDVLQHCWEADEARTFIAAAKALGPQPAAFYTLALDSSARKAELFGLKYGGDRTTTHQDRPPTNIWFVEKRGEPHDLHCLGDRGLTPEAQGVSSRTETGQPDPLS
jgi:hypothetical protein